MAVINASGKFRSFHSKSVPIVPVPKNVRQALNIERMYKNGIARLNPQKQTVFMTDVMFLRRLTILTRMKAKRYFSEPVYVMAEINEC
ncbi:hypothetical protein NIA73_01105 [Anaerobutyricum hallii]|nr:hypothetical protein [Anaerobutyricum hallii]